jgi:hypothetical protein
MLESYQRFSTGMYGHVIHTARKIIDVYVEGGDTAHIRALGISKALDKVNWYGLYIYQVD